jgi:chromosome segregation ATPase
VVGAKALAMTLSEIFSFLAICVSAYAIFSQRNFRKSQESINFTQSDSTNLKDALTLKAEYKSELKELHDQLEKEREARKSVESELVKAHVLISELMARDLARENTVRDLQEQFRRDALLRANVENALHLSNEKIIELNIRLNDAQQRISVLEDELDKRDKEILERDRRISDLERGLEHGID